MPLQWQPRNTEAAMGDRKMDTADEAAARLVLLGTGTPNADPDRAGPASAVVVGDQAWLVDCGPGVVRRAAAAYRNGIETLAPRRLTRLLLTHLHSDHTAGLADVVLSPWTLGRSEPLEVYGPRGTRAMVDHLLEAYREDIRERIEGLEPCNETGWQVRVHEIEPGEALGEGTLRVEAFAVDHGAWPAFGFRFEAPGRTLVLSGDTAPARSVMEQASGCDLLLHEVYSAAGFEQRPPGWQRYHAHMHTSSRELGRLAASARPGLLVLHHQLFWGASEEELLAEIREEYDGPVVSGRDLDVF
jgi:ribonuclease BN (tRNA processing enzyme)